MLFKFLSKVFIGSLNSLIIFRIAQPSDLAKQYFALFDNSAKGI